MVTPSSNPPQQAPSKTFRVRQNNAADGGSAPWPAAAKGRLELMDTGPSGAWRPSARPPASKLLTRGRPGTWQWACTIAVCLLFAGGAGLFAFGAHLKGEKPSASPGFRPGGPLEQAVVLLSADGPVGEHQHFWLDAPRRLVVDLMGVRQASRAPIIAPQHSLIKRVRVGRHEDRVRFVIEVAPEAHHHVVARADGSSLTVTLRAKEPADE